MLSEAQNNKILQIISDTSSTFEKSLEKFRATFKKMEYFSAAWAIKHWLKLNVFILFFIRL